MDREIYFTICQSTLTQLLAKQNRKLYFCQTPIHTAADCGKVNLPCKAISLVGGMLSLAAKVMNPATVFFLLSNENIIWLESHLVKGNTFMNAAKSI